MALPVALQLYTVRDDLAEDFNGTLAKVKEMGYEGVELSGLNGADPVKVKEMLDAAEVIVTSSGTLCRPVKEIDGVSVGGKAPDILNKLRDALVKDFMDKTE